MGPSPRGPAAVRPPGHGGDVYIFQAIGPFWFTSSCLCVCDSLQIKVEEGCLQKKEFFYKSKSHLFKRRRKTLKTKKKKKKNKKKKKKLKDQKNLCYTLIFINNNRHRIIRPFKI